MFKSGQLCTIVKNAYNSNLPDSYVSYMGIKATKWGKAEIHVIPEGTPVLVIQSLESHCKVLIWDELFMIKNEALEIV
jgi:hypothetical protein